MKRTLELILAGFLVSSAQLASAAGPVTTQSTTATQNMNNTLRKMRTQHAPLLQETLRERNLPKSVIETPNKVLKTADHELKAPLELGLIGEPTAVQGANSVLEVRSNGNSSTLKRVQVTATTGNIQGPAAIQHMQVTSDNSPVPVANVPAAPRPYRDPRLGIQATDQNVVQWRASGASVNPNVVTGSVKMRTLRPLSPGMSFRNSEIPAGSHLVTTVSSSNATTSFNGTSAPTAISPAVKPAAPGAPANAATPIKTQTYLLKAKQNGGFKHVKLTAQEATDLQASQPQRSFTIQNGEVKDNIAPGYDPQSLRSSGFTP